jgi:hypothetical protein
MGGSGDRRSIRFGRGDLFLYGAFGIGHILANY